MIAQIKGIAQEEGTTTRVIAFVQKRTAYGSVDLGGQNRRSYSPEIRVITVPGIARLGIKHILHAFAAGADGIIFVEGDDSIFNKDMLRKRVKLFKKYLGKFGIHPLKLQPAITTLKKKKKVLSLLTCS